MECSRVTDSNGYSKAGSRVKNILCIGNSHAVSLVDAGRHRQGISSVRQDSDFAWFENGFRRFDFPPNGGNDDGLVYWRIILACGAAPQLVIPICNQDDTLILSRHGGVLWREDFVFQMT